MKMPKIDDLIMHLKYYLLVMYLVTHQLNACEITMGYRTSERLPLISKSPSNEGLYFSLYSQALSNIGCQLRVIRAPKKRILHMLKVGEIDFYPGLGRSIEREKYLYFIETGLRNKSALLSHVDAKKINTLSYMRGKTLLFSKGSQPIKGEEYGIIMRRVHELSIEKAVKVIANKQADFYIYGENTLKYFPTMTPNNKVKIQDLNSDFSPIYLGFAKKSKFAQSLSQQNVMTESFINNPEYKLAKNKGYEFQQALVQLEKQGFTDKLFKEFYQR